MNRVQARRLCAKTIVFGAYSVGYLMEEEEDMGDKDERRSWLRMKHVLARQLEGSCLESGKWQWLLHPPVMMMMVTMMIRVLILYAYYSVTIISLRLKR